MSPDKSLGFNILRCVVAAITMMFQFILILAVSEAPIPYLLSNISIIAGYMLDVYTLTYNYPTLKKPMVFSLAFEAVALVIAMGDILFIASYKIVGIMSGLIIPIVTLVALALYLIINIIIAISAGKNKEDFITE